MSLWESVNDLGAGVSPDDFRQCFELSTVGPSQWLVRCPGTHYRTVSASRRVMTTFQTRDCFKHSLKTFLFSGYWRTERSRGVHDSALYKCTFTYLLTYLLVPAEWREEIDGQAGECSDWVDRDITAWVNVCCLNVVGGVDDLRCWIPQENLWVSLFDSF